MSKAKRLHLFAQVAASALIAAGCTARAQKQEWFGVISPPPGQVLRYVSGSEVESLDPQMSSSQVDARIDVAIFEGLLEYHPKTLEPVPGIAERWTNNGDASEFVFFLRHNAKFSNGDPIKARDFVYTVRRGLRPELASRVAFMAYDIKYAEAFNDGSAFVRDPKTGRFVLASEAAEGEGGGAAQATPAKAGEDAAADTEFHRLIHEPERLVVPFDEKQRAKKVKPGSKLASL